MHRRIETLLSINGARTVDSLHRELGHIMWENCGMKRNATGRADAISRIRELKRSSVATSG